MADQKLPDINAYINELPFDVDTQDRLYEAFYSTDPISSFDSIKGVPAKVKQTLFDIRGKAEQGQPYSLEDIYISVKPSKKVAGLAEEEKPKEEWVGPKEALREREFKATTAIPVVGKSPEVSPTPFAKKKEVEVDFFGRPVQPKASKTALAPKLVKLEKPKPGAAKEAPEEGAPVPATAPPPVVAEPKTAEPPAPLLSREEMESRYANYIKEQAEKAEKALREKQPKGKVDKGKDSTAKKYQDIQIQAEEIATPPSPVIVLNPYKPGTPEYEAERKRPAQAPVEVVQGPAKSFSEGLGQTIEYSVEQVPKAAKAISKAAAASEPGGKEYVTKKELLESGKTMREPLARPELLVPGGDGRKDLTREFVRGTLEAIGGLTAPETIAVVAGTKGLGTAAGLATGVAKSALKAATSALSAYFTGQAGVSAYEKGKEAVELYEKGDYTGAARALGVGSIDALFALMGAAHSGKKATESFKEGYARGQRRRARVGAETEAKFRKKLEEDFEPVPGQPGMLRLKKKPAEVAAGELPAAGEPKSATAKERSIIEYYKEDPTGVYSKLVFDIAKKSAEIAQESKAKSPNESKIKKLGKELNSLDKQKAIIDRIRQEGKSEQPVAPPPVVTTEPAQPPLAISAEPPPVVEKAPVVEPPPVVEPTPAAAEPVKAAVEPTVKPTVAETFSTPGGAKITDITQTSPEGFTPGIDYIPETDFIFDVEGIGKFTVIPSTEKPGSFAIWPEGDIAPAAVVEGANAKEAFTSFIDKPAPEVKVEAPVTPTGATEAPPAPGVTAPTAKPPVEEPKAATEPPPPVVAAAPPMPAPAPVQPPAPPVVEPKPVEKKSPPPERRSMIQRGMNDPVTVFFKDSVDKALFNDASKFSAAIRGKKDYSSDVVKRLENYKNDFSKKLGIQPQEAQSLIARYREMVIDRAKGMPKTEPDVLEVPSFIEFAKAEIEAAKAKLTPAPEPVEPTIKTTPEPPVTPKARGPEPAIKPEVPPAKETAPSGKIAASDIEEISRTPEGEIELAYGKKRYQAVPAFGGKGYRIYDMESGSKLGEVNDVADPAEALAGVLDAEVATPVSSVEVPKIQTKYIEPETPQYREGGELIALKLRADRDPVIYAKNTTMESLVRILYKNKFSAAAIKALGVNISPSSNLHSIIQKILDSKNFNGSSSERELLEVFSKNLNEGKAKSKGGSVTIVNTDSLHRGVLVLPSAYEALKGSVKSGQVAKVAPVSSLIETLRHENVHSNTTSAIKKISQSDISKIGQDANFKKFQQILKKGGYSKADTDIYMAIDELAAHFLSGSFQFFSENGMTPEELADAYSLVRPYILAIDKDAVARAERFKKPGLKVSGSIKPSEGLSSTEKTMPMRGKEGGLSNIRYSLSTSNPPSASVVKKEFQEAGTPDKYSNTDKDDNFYYHVTTKPAANQIKKTGIFPRKSGGAMSPGFYSEYSKGKAFFSERSGVSYWADVISRHIENQTGKEPNLVVLRFPKDMAVDLEVDEVGSKDSGRPSYYVKGNILGEKYKSNPLSKENLKKYFLYHEDPSSGKRKVIATSETEQELKDERERIYKSGKYSSWNTKIAPSSSYEYYMNPSRR